MKPSFLLIFSVIYALASQPLALADTSKSTKKTAQASSNQTFDCGHDSMEWMRNCDDVNRSITQRSEKKIRIETKEGVELYFAPDTPTTWIKLVVMRTPTAARKHVEWEEKSWAVQEQARDLLRNEYTRRGRNVLPQSKDFSLTDYRDKIRYEQVKLFVFTDSNCNICKRLYPILGQLKRIHPKLKITLLQVNKDQKTLDAIQAKYKLKGYVLSDKQYKTYRPVFKDRTPTLLFENRKLETKFVTVGYQSLIKIEKDLARISGAMQ